MSDEDVLKTEKRRRSDIRIATLRRIMADRFGGKQAALAEALGRQPDYLSRLFSNKKALDDGLAREFERRLELPAFTLEIGHGLTPMAIEVARWFSRMPVDRQQELEPTFKTIMGPHVSDEVVEERMPVTKRRKKP